MWTTPIGAILVLIGCLGLNISSEGTLDELTGLIALNMIVAAATGACGWVVAEKLSTSTVSRTAPSAGAVAGLVAIAPGCASFSPGWASAIGLLAGATCAFAVLASRRRRRGSRSRSSTSTWSPDSSGCSTSAFPPRGPSTTAIRRSPSRRSQRLSVSACYSFAASWILGYAVDKSVGFGIPRSAVEPGATTSSITELAGPKKFSK